MALALAAHGVPGCVLEDYHLGPIGSDVSLRGHGRCWAFPVERGIWMEDWDVDLNDAITAARRAAATPVTRAMLDIISRDMELPFSASPKATGRLLDISILTGNQKAAVKLSKKCQLRPLRRWVMDWNTINSEDCWEATRTALWAGADLQDLMVKQHFSCPSEDVPFPQALFLHSKLGDWQEIRHLLPRGRDLWRPRNLDNQFGEFFLEGPHGPGGGWKLSLDKIRAAEDAGVDLQFLSVAARRDGSHLVCPSWVTLLDWAIWCGQPDCAEACVDRSIELEGDDTTLAWHEQVLHGESLSLSHPHPGLDVVPSEAQTAASASGCAWLKRLWKSESSQKGIVLYQMMLNMFKGRSFPMVLVQEILTFSMPVPKIIDQLDLWEHVGDWMATIFGRPTSVHGATDCSTADVEEPEGMQDNDEAGRLLYIEVLVFFSTVCCQ